VVDGGISILQYDGHTILFMEHDLGKAVNMKLIIYFFEQQSGLEIIFYKTVFLVRQKMKRSNIDIFLDVKLVLFLQVFRNTYSL
jgi:hypothetical protein